MAIKILLLLDAAACGTGGLVVINAWNPSRREEELLDILTQTHVKSVNTHLNRSLLDDDH